MIEVNNLVKYYGERKVLHEVSFKVEVGTICGFLGPNGSGKSTTMDILSGILGASSGEVSICGNDVISSPNITKKDIGYLPDDPPLYKDMTVKDFIKYIANLRGIYKNYKRAVAKVLDDCDIFDVKDRIIGNLSKGYKQRVALSAALVHEPKVLVLDEPTEGLDPKQIVHIRELIKKISKDRTVILSSHILSEVQAICDDVVIINEGVVVARENLSQNDSKAVNVEMGFYGDDSVKDIISQYEGIDNIEIKNNNLLFKIEHSEDLNKKIAYINSELNKKGIQVYNISYHKTEIEQLFFDVIKSSNKE